MGIPPSRRTQGPTNHRATVQPLLTNLQASAMSDSNTRQRQNTQLYKDTRSRLQETDTLKTVMRQAKEIVREREIIPLAGA